MYLPTTRDRHFVLRIADPLHQLSPVVHVQLAGLAGCSFSTISSSSFVLDQAERHFVDRELLVRLLDDGPLLDVAEQGDLLGVVAAERPLGAARSGCRAGCRSAAAARRCAASAWSSASLAAFRYGTSVRWMNRQFCLADVERNLADRFEERQPLDVADRAADFGDDHVHVRPGQLAGSPP